MMALGGELSTKPYSVTYDSIDLAGLAAAPASVAGLIASALVIVAAIGRVVGPERRPVGLVQQPYDPGVRRRPAAGHDRRAARVAERLARLGSGRGQQPAVEQSPGLQVVGAAGAVDEVTGGAAPVRLGAPDPAVQRVPGQLLHDLVHVRPGRVRGAGVRRRPEAAEVAKARQVDAPLLPREQDLAVAG